MFEGLHHVFCLEHFNVSSWTLLLATVFFAWFLWDHFKNRNRNQVSTLHNESEVAKWLAHWLLVLEVPGSIPAGGEEYLLVRTRFPSCHLQE